LSTTPPPAHNRHEVNCLTKEEFERSSRSASLARQGSQIQSPLSSSSSAATVQPTPPADGAARGWELEVPDANGERAPDEATRARNELGNKALALMVQPSVDYGE
jgi:hypothetical protein